MAAQRRAADAVSAASEAARAGALAPAEAVAAWAEASARRLGGSLLGSGLRLFERYGGVATRADDFDELAPAAPSDLGHLYEHLLSGDDRARRGVHLTPVDVAAGLVGLLDGDWLHAPARVLDPAVGGGAFLLAAADARVDAGDDAADVLRQLYGVDIDPVAVGVAEAALALWGLAHGLDPAPRPQLRAADGLLDPLPAADIVVGNPPFLNQLRGAAVNMGERRELLRDRWGDLVTSYTDEAWLFLAAAVDALEPGGQTTLVQPVSVLAARHGAAVRDWIEERATLVGLWIADGRVFEASVEVCGPVLRRGGERSTTRRWCGRDFAELAPTDRAIAANRWGSAGAIITGVPDVAIATADDGRTVGDIARVTAGFRDQFYGFAPFVSDAEPDEQLDGLDGTQRPLVTVGMIDPLAIRWGTDRFRFAGVTVERPVIDGAALDSADPDLGRWADDRRRPKVLVATQTRIIEAWVDTAGHAVPATPVISVEPEDPNAIWRVAAVLMAPPLAATSVAENFGTAMSVRALKLSANAVASLPLPVDRSSWDRGAELAEQLQNSAGFDRDACVAFARAMCRAFAVSDDQNLIGWWIDRWPRRTRGGND